MIFRKSSSNKRKTVVSNPQTYRLGNQPEEFALLDTYLHWKPKGFKDWAEYRDRTDVPRHGPDPRKVTLQSPEEHDEQTILLHQFISRDAFHLNTFGEDRFKNWWNFFLAAFEEDPDKVYIFVYNIPE